MSFWTIILASLLAWLLIVVPPLYHLGTTRRLRYDNLRAYLKEDAIKMYYRLFFPSITVESEVDLGVNFEQKYKSAFGWRKFFFPCILLFSISAIGFCFVTNSLIAWLDPKHTLKPIPPIAMSAFFGAYLWVVFDQLVRIRVRDFTSYDVYRFKLRFVIAVPSGYAFAATVKEPIGIPIAFFVGVLPLGTILKYGKRFVSQQIGIGDRRGSEPAELEKLQSVNRIEAERFDSIGITNLLDLAYADPIDITLRTNFNFSYVNDCISQALLWIYFENHIDTLRQFGIRSAYEAIVLMNYYKAVDDPEKRAIAESKIKEIVESIGTSAESFLYTLSDVALDPHAVFLCEVWVPGYQAGDKMHCVLPQKVKNSNSES